MKKFYRINESADANEIGFAPQVHDAIVDFDIYDERSAYHLNFSQADENTLWPISKLSSKAKKTDLVSVSFMGLSGKLLISEKLQSILSNSNHAGLQFVPTTLIEKGGKEYPYWIVNPAINSIFNPDLLQSTFAYLKGLGSNEKVKEVRFNNSNALIDTINKNREEIKTNGIENFRPLVIGELTIKEDTSLDFFAVSPLMYGGVGYFVSEDLKDQIENAGCTGIVFTNPNERYPQ